MKKEELLKQLEGGLIVSCQALEHEPMYSEKGGIMDHFALAAYQAGACGIRANSVRDIKEIKAMVNLPIIGIIKQDYDGYEAYITPTMKEVDALVEEGVDIIAIEFTSQTRPEYDNAYEFALAIKEKYPEQLLMADCATIEDAKKADLAKIDFIGTTMCGYTKDSIVIDGPNYEFIKEIKKYCNAPIIGEGKINTPLEAKKVLELGVLCVVVGSAITRPLEITKRFMSAIKEN